MRGKREKKHIFLSFYIDSYSVTVYNRDMQEELHLSIEELADLTDIPVRTIRYYITEGLLPGPEGRGKAAAYGEEHLLKLRLIRRLSLQHMPLAEMYHLLNRLSLDELRTLLTEEEQSFREAEQAKQPSPQDYIAGLLKKARSARPDPSPGFSAQQQRIKKEVEAPHPPREETWRRWELAPGIELHIKEGAEEQHRYLLERIFKLVGRPFHIFKK